MERKNKKRKEKNRKLLERIQLDSFQRMSWAKARKTNLYVETKSLRKGHIIQAGHQRIPMERETLMVFADDAPLYNWGHPCRYLLHDSKTGELYQEVNANFPPYLVEPPKTYKIFSQPVTYVRTEKFRIKRFKDWSKLIKYPLGFYVQGKRYAVLFSGASNYRHVNDLEFLYRTLIDVYNFSSDNIYVLNYDGTINYTGNPKPVGNWPGDDTAYRMPVTAAGTKSELENILDDLKGRLNMHDFLLIHTNNHGGHDGTESYLCTHSGPDYTASDFAAKMAELPKFAQLIVMMEQCHSGGFNTPIIDHGPADETTIASACREDRSSTGGDGIFDPFARDWIAAVTGTDPYGGALDYDPDTNSDGMISASEAFDYADTIKDPYDTPVYDETPAACGDDMHLGQPEPVYVLRRIEKFLKWYYELKEPMKPWPEPEPEPWPGPRPGPYIYDEIIRRIGELEKLIRRTPV